MRKFSLFNRRRFLQSSAALIGASTLPPVSWASNSTDVIVIGAGLSGLYAAQLLEQVGLSVKVLEGRDRIGGRLHTLNDVPGAPEAGGQTIGPNYGRMIYVAQKAGVSLHNVNFRLGNEPVRQLIHAGGERILPAEWATSPYNPFPQAYKTTLPDRLLNQVIGSPPLVAGNAWLKPEFAELDYPVARLFKTKGFNQAAIDIAGISNNYGPTLEEASLLFLHRNNAIVTQSMSTPGGVKIAKGGNQRVPEGMAKMLKTGIRLNSAVTQIRHASEGYMVKCADNSQHNARYVIAAVPFSTLRHVDLQLDLPAIQQEAIEQLAYGKVFQAHFAVEQPFWEGKGFLPNVWSDSIIERVFASDPSNTGKITNLTVWINGKGADLVAQLPPKEAEKQILSAFYEALPEAKGAVRFVTTYSWDSQTMSRGSFATWRPGQINRYAHVMATPAGDLHFAGEHTARWSSGMEGALESGERAANEIIAKLSR
ncbi:MAG: FAD-dependent oxidoreductase [Alteromonadaceae bacterium]|nr:FAD-dependent oxidoreductase [Alteromonadaceae bacterium]